MPTIVQRNLCALSLCACLLGCGGASDKPDLGLVTGKVTRGGVPVLKAKIYFTPVAGGRASEAVTQGDGSYELVYVGGEKGAAVGEHKVVITTFEPQIIQDDGTKTGGRPEELPAQYTSGTERRTVTAGAQVIDFAL